MHFLDKLAIASKKSNSLLCVGLDPDLTMIPDDYVAAFNRLIIESTIDVACAYKPNLAIYESMGKEGLEALDQTLNIIREMNPDAIIIGDGKRGDIGLCSYAYTKMLFDKYKFDAVTVNPYMGSDSVAPFLNDVSKGIFILCRTSNPGGRDIQELRVIQEGKSVAQPLYEVVAELALEWNKNNNNVGLVVGATYPEQVSRLRNICPNMPFLIPGVGFQGGNIERTVQSAVDSKGGGFIINVSRQIMYSAKNPKGKLRTVEEAKEKMHKVACKIKDEINNYLPKPAKERQDTVFDVVELSSY